MTPELEYLLSSGIWSLGGLVVGYALGRIERDVQDIKTTLKQKDDSHDDT